MDCCGKVGKAHYHCGLCHNTFGSLADFDDHQVRRFGQDPPITCKTPESLGLVTDENGTWRTPEGLSRYHADAARMARINAGRATTAHAA